MNKKLQNYFTDQEMWRIIDLANRRVIDNGEDFYSYTERVMFIKMRKAMKLVPKNKRDSR